MAEISADRDTWCREPIATMVAGESATIGGNPKIRQPSTKTRSITFFRPNFTGHAVAERRGDGGRILTDCLVAFLRLFCPVTFTALRRIGALLAPQQSGFAAVHYQYNAGPNVIPVGRLNVCLSDLQRVGN